MEGAGLHPLDAIPFLVDRMSALPREDVAAIATAAAIVAAVILTLACWSLAVLALQRFIAAPRTLRRDRELLLLKQEVLANKHHLMELEMQLAQLRIAQAPRAAPRSLTKPPAPSPAMSPRVAQSQGLPPDGKLGSRVRWSDGGDDQDAAAGGFPLRAPPRLAPASLAVASAPVVPAAPPAAPLSALPGPKDGSALGALLEAAFAAMPGAEAVTNSEVASFLQVKAGQ